MLQMSASKPQAKDDFRRPVVPGGHNGAVILV